TASADPPAKPEPAAEPVPPPAPVAEAAPAPAAEPAAAAPAASGGDDYPAFKGAGACKMATKGRSPVAKACSEGGAKAAKKVMKAMLKQWSKSGGEKMECDACHMDDNDITKLADDAKEKFKKLEGVYKE